MAVVKNLASVMTTANITSSATSIPVNRTNVFGASQNPLDNPFYVTIMPTSGSEPANTTNSEIALVTGISGTNLIVTRGQRSTTARAFTSGAIVTNGIYAEDAVLLGEAGTAVNPQPWIDTSEIKNGAITDEKIDFSKFFVKDTHGDQRAINSLGTIGVLQIPTTGVWLISWYGRCYWGGTSGTGSLLKIDVGNTPETATTEIYNMGLKNLFVNGDTLRENAPAPVPLYVEAGKYVVVRCPAAANGTITGIVNGAYALRVG